MRCRSLNSKHFGSTHNDTLDKANPGNLGRLFFPYYLEKARDLPWRKTEDPYAILVSEIMLQQTQVPRVIEKYKAWIRRFPTHFGFSSSRYADNFAVLTGLGYNRRALYLKQCADEIVKIRHFSHNTRSTQKLPGIGPHTSQSICVFVCDQPHPLIETNVRTIYIHHFFADKTSCWWWWIIATCCRLYGSDNPRKWFNALMDYGTFLKEQMPNPSRKSTGYVKQSPRTVLCEVRGWILKQLSTKLEITSMRLKLVLVLMIPVSQRPFLGLVKDGLITDNNQLYCLK